MRITPPRRRAVDLHGADDPVQPPGNDRQIKDNYGYQAGIGINLPHSWALEGDFSRGYFDIKGTDGTRRLDADTVDVIKKFLPADIMERSSSTHTSSSAAAK